MYAYVEACEPFLAGGRTLAEIAVLADPELGDDPGPAGVGTVRALQQLRRQFDIVPPDADLSAYELVIVPESVRVAGELPAALSAFLAAGGAVLLSGPAALDDAGQPALAESGIVTAGMSPFTHTFLRPSAALAGVTVAFDTVMYERGFRMAPLPGAEALCGVVEPYFERAYDHFSGHEYTPPADLGDYAALVQNGRVITVAVPLLEAFGRHANVPYRELLGGCIDRLLPRPLLRAGPCTWRRPSCARRRAPWCTCCRSCRPGRRRGWTWCTTRSRSWTCRCRCGCPNHPDG